MAVNLGEGYVPLYLTGMSNFRSGLSAAHRQLSMTVQRMDAIGRQARYGLMIAAGATAGALRIAGGFDQGMARVQALTGATGGTFDALREQAMVLGRTTVFTGRQAADAMGYFALAGFDAQKIMQAMPATLNLAAAGQIDVAESADIAAKIMAGMGIEATELTHVMDVLTQAFTTSNTDLRMLGDAFKYVGPVGRSAGKSVEELAATIMAMSNAGIQGQMAGVALRSILVRLTSQPAEVKKALEMLGMSIEDDSGRMKHLAEIVDEVRTAMAGYTPVQQQAIMAMLAGTRAVAAFSVMVEEGGDAIRGMEDRLQGAAGTAEQIASIQLDTLYGSFKLLWSAVEGLAIALGDRLSPVIRSLTDRITEFTNSLAGNNERLDEFVTIGENVVRVLATIVGMVALLKGVAAALGAVAAMGGPLTIGLTALAAAVAYIGVAWIEAQARGETFSDRLSRNLRSLIGLSASLTDQLNTMDNTMDTATRKYMDIRGASFAEKRGGLAAMPGTTPDQIKEVIKAAHAAATEAANTANEAARHADEAEGYRKVLWERLRDAAIAREEALKKDLEALSTVYQAAKQRAAIAEQMASAKEGLIWEEMPMGPEYPGPRPPTRHERLTPAMMFDEEGFKRFFRSFIMGEPTAQAQPPEPFKPGPRPPRRRDDITPALMLSEHEYKAAIRKYSIATAESISVQVKSAEGAMRMVYIPKEAAEKEKEMPPIEFSGIVDFWRRTQERIQDETIKLDKQRNALLEKIQGHVEKWEGGLG